MRVEPFEPDIQEIETGLETPLNIVTSDLTTIDSERCSESILTLYPGQDNMEPSPSIQARDLPPPPASPPPPPASPPTLRHTTARRELQSTPRRSPRRRRHTRREPPITQDAARRALIQISERRALIEERNSETLRKILEEMKEIKVLLQLRYLEDDQPFLKKYWRYSYIGLTILIHIFASSFQIPELLAEEEMTEFVYLIPSILVTIHAVLKSIVLIPKTRQVSAFIKELGFLWRVKFTSRQRREKDALLWRLNFINRATFWTTVGGTSLYLLSPLFETLFRRFILKKDCELLLPLASSYPFNPTKNWLIYILVYIFQLYSMTVLVAIYMGASLIMIALCALLGTEFLMLKDDLAQVKPKSNRGIYHNEIDDGNDGHSIETFVERHQKLLRLSRQLDNIFNGMVFIDLLFVGITTCAFIFMGQFPIGPGYMLVSYIGTATSLLTVLNLCYYGELLTRASSSIGDTAYENLWYNGDKQYKMAIFLIIKISQKPCCLTSSRYAVVSMSMFTKVVSTTWSYFSLMNSVYSEE